MKQTPIDSEKALQVFLYLAPRLPEEKNMYKILKAIYRANKLHLEKYGREIFHEQYQALPFGTVPSLSYDVVTHVRDGKDQPRMPERVKEHLAISGDTIKALAEPNMRLLSQSDVECLDEAIEFYRKMSFDDVKNNAHEDEAYKASKINEFIPLERIILTLPDGKLLLEHLKAA